MSAINLEKAIEAGNKMESGKTEIGDGYMFNDVNRRMIPVYQAKELNLR